MPPSMLDHAALSARFFFPRRAKVDPAFWVDTHDGERLACFRATPHPGAPTVVYFHGNGEVVSDMLPAFPSWMASLGCNVVLAEYRGYGMSTGMPALVSQLDDVGTLLDAIDVPDERLVLFGRSLGSLYAIEGARRRPGAAALVLESGIFDVGERVRLRVSAADVGATEEELDAELARYFDPVGSLAAFRGHTLVLHTRHDTIVAAHHAESSHAAAREPKKLVLFDDGGHNDIFWRNREAYMAAVAELLRSLR
ncbi:MAG: alpha/beta hydrolase [Polyangiaceae bacterium]|nr:alpha/beta hydrolase [Polyangiaceae bacterium]